MRTCFVTGLYRSGTTLVQRLLDSHPLIRLENQSCTDLFLHTKQQFLAEKNITTDLPLDPLFGNEKYSQQEWYNYLQKIHFAETYTSQFNKDKNDVSLSGDKEIICEEFIPYLLDEGIQVILIIRDIRDVLCSLNFENGTQFMGDIRPTLFHLQNWRKSIAFALHLQQHPNLCLIRYEDLVSEPAKTLATLGSFIKRDLDPVTNWEGNSSFGATHHISAQSVQRWKALLSKDLIQYIEALCFTELKSFGYEITTERPESRAFETMMKAFQEPFSVKHPSHDPLYSTDATQVQLEIQRYKQLWDHEEGVAEPYFIFLDVRDTLQSL